MITTLRNTDKDRWYLDITVDADGSVAHTVGPLESKELAQRWERYALLRYRTWENILSWDVKHNFARQAMFDMALRKLVGETDECTRIPFPAGHKNWILRHPLHSPLTVAIWIENQDADTGLFDFTLKEREHIRDGSYADLEHCCDVCIAIDSKVYTEEPSNA